MKYFHLKSKAQNRLEAWANKSILWVIGHMSERNYMILASILIGLIAGIAAVTLKFTVFKVQEWMEGYDPTQGKIGFVLFPILGLILTYLYLRFVLRKPLDMGFSGLVYNTGRFSKNRVLQISDSLIQPFCRMKF